MQTVCHVLRPYLRVSAVVMSQQLLLLLSRLFVGSMRENGRNALTLALLRVLPFPIHRPLYLHLCLFDGEGHLLVSLNRSFSQCFSLELPGLLLLFNPF